MNTAINEQNSPACGRDGGQFERGLKTVRLAVGASKYITSTPFHFGKFGNGDGVRKDDSKAS